MSSESKGNAVILRLRKLHQQRIELDESYQNVSSSSYQREPISRIKKPASNGKHLQPQIPSTTRQDDLLRNSKKTQKELFDSDLSDQRVETRQKASVPKRKSAAYNEMSNQPTQKPPFSFSKRNLISTIEDSSKQANQRPPFSNIKKNQFSNIDETSKQPIQKPPFSAGKKNYSSVTNEANSASKQKQKLTNKAIKGSNNKKKDQTKKQDQSVYKQSISKKIDQSIKSDLTVLNNNKSNASRKKQLNEESEINLKKQQADVAKATKGVERNPKSSRFSNLRSAVNESLNDVPSYDFRSKQTELIQNVNNNRSNAVDEYYRKIPGAKTITVTKDDSQDMSDELIKQAAAFLRKTKKKKENSNSNLLQKTSSPLKKNPVSRIQQEDQPFSWGNMLKSISSEEDLSSSGINQNKTKKSTTMKKIGTDHLNKASHNNNIYKGEYDESDELNLFFTPEKDLPTSIRNATKIPAYSNSNLRANLLDESDSASIGNDHYMDIKNDIYLSTESDTEIVPDSLSQKTTDFMQKGQIADIMRQKLVKVLNSDSAELSSSSGIDRPEVNKIITISKNNSDNIYSNLINSDASEDIFNNLQQPLQQSSITKNPNSRLSTIENYNKVNSSKLSRFAQKNVQNSNQNAFSSEGDDYLSSDSKSEEIFSITDSRIDDSNIIKSRITKFDRKQNQGKLTVEQIKKNLLDSATDNSSTKSAEYDEFPDLIISNVSSKKAIKQYNIIKNSVLDEIQSSESSSPEFLKLASKNSIDISGTKDDEPIQNNILDRFSSARLSSIVFSDSESHESRKYEKDSDEINIDDDDEIPTVKKPPQPEPQMEQASQNVKVSNIANIKNDEDERSSVKNDPQYSNVDDEGEDDEDEIPKMKKLPQPEPQMVNQSAKASDKKLAIQKMIPDIIEEEEDEMPAMKTPPQPEPQITEMSKKTTNKKEQNTSNINDFDDDEIPVAKKPPQPEPQIASADITKTKTKSLSNKNQSIQQKDFDINEDEDDTQGSDIPIPQIDIFNNKIDSDGKSKKSNKPKLENSNSVIDSDSDNELNIKNKPKGEKSKSSPLHLSPPIGITYFSRVGENDKFKPLSFDDNDQLIEDKTNFDKKQKFGDDEEEEAIENDEKVEIVDNDMSHSFENDDNEEPVNDSFEEKLKMARNTISKIKGNRANNQKAFNLFNNSFEEEEKLENNDLLPEDEVKSETQNAVNSIKGKENKIHSTGKEKKRLQFNSIKDDDDEIETDFNENQFKPTKDVLNSQFKLDDIDDDVINNDLNEKQLKSSNSIMNSNTASGINVKQSKFKNNVSDDDEEEPFELNNQIGNKELNPIKVENIGEKEELEEDHFEFNNIESGSSDDDLDKKLNIKDDDEFEKEAVITSSNRERNKSFENIVNENANNSPSLSQLMEKANDVIKNQKAKQIENEEEDNGNIIINSQIELEEDEEEAPIDPYFLDNDLSENSSDMNEDQSLKEDSNKKLPSLEENTLTIKKNNDNNSDDSDIKDFEDLKKNFLNPEFNFDDKSYAQDEEESKSELSANKISKVQNVISTNLHKEIASITGEEEDEINENINKVNIDDVDDDDDEDQILQSLNEFNSQMELLSKSNSRDIDDSNKQKTDDVSKGNQIGSIKFLKIPDIDDEESENEIDDTSLTEKVSNLINLNNAEEEEYELEEEQENVTIKKSDNLEKQNDKTSVDDLPTSSAKQTDLNDSSALDFLNQDDFLEDRLFLSKNKNIMAKNGGQKQPEEDENDETNAPQNVHVDDNAFSFLIEEEEEEEFEVEEKNSKQSIDFSKSNEAFHKINSIQMPLDNKDGENEISRQNKTIMISNSNEMKSKFVANRPQAAVEKEEEEEEDENNYTLLIKKENPIISDVKNQTKNVEYEYEYEIEEDVEEVQKSDETKENITANQIQIKNEIKGNDEKIDCKQDLVKINLKIPENIVPNEIVEYEYEYEEEKPEEVQKLPEDGSSKSPKVIISKPFEEAISKSSEETYSISSQKVNGKSEKATNVALSIDNIQIEIEIDERNRQQKTNEASPIIANNSKDEIVEYEYEYEEEKLEEIIKTYKEKTDKLASELSQIGENKAKAEEEEDFDEEAIIQRLQNFKSLNFDNDLAGNELRKYDTFEEEEENEEDISDDSLIKRLDQGILSMGKDTNFENSDDNELDDIDDDVLHKKVQDFLDLPNSDNDIEEESFIDKVPK